MVGPVDTLEQVVRDFQDLDARAPSFTREELFHRVVGGIHRLCAHIGDCERTGVPRDDILRIVAPARAIHRRSPFIERLQTWPRGYPGDFETIDYLCAQRPAPPPGTVEHVCEQYSLTCAAAQQHRNKVHRQSDLIAQVVAGCPGARVLIVASGSCPDVAHSIPLLRGSKVEIVLNDSDPDALAAAERNLAAIRQNISLRPGDALRLLRRSRDLGTFDLVLAGGLFDYLFDRAIVFILSQVYHHLLRDGATFFFTNIARGNPYRLWITYLADWHLIERDADDIRRVVAESNIPLDNLEVETDQTTLTLLTRLTR
jgi:extracellular factor (EF) 3-hydroxypalmitic acid methyl ester biosynthesis protein